MFSLCCCSCILTKVKLRREKWGIMRINCERAKNLWVMLAVRKQGRAEQGTKGVIGLLSSNDWYKVIFSQQY